MVKIKCGGSVHVIPDAQSLPSKKPENKRGALSVLNEIREYQRSTELFICKAPFNRLVREIAQGFKTDIRFGGDSLTKLMEAAEYRLVAKFQEWNLLHIEFVGISRVIKMIPFELPDDIVRKIAIEAIDDKMDNSVKAFTKLFINVEQLFPTSENSDSECDSDNAE